MNAPYRDGMQTVPVTPPLYSKKRKRPCTTVVLHATAGASATSSIEYLRQPKSDSPRGYSYHAIIERDGTVYKCCPYGDAALHCGKSEGPHGPDVNGYSVGICFANLQDGSEEITPIQVQTAIQLIEALKTQFPTLTHLVTHHGIAPTRRRDPKGIDPREVAKAVGLEPWKVAGAHWVT